jgi:hypothetical protein
MDLVEIVCESVDRILLAQSGVQWQALAEYGNEPSVSIMVIIRF